jgi:hypothetical protein
MEGSITQLGLSNYLINNNAGAVSFFKHAYKNHTNFAKDTRELNFKNGINFGQTASFRFDEDGKYGDLITNIIVAIDLPDISGVTNVNGRSVGYCNGIGNAIAENIYLRINGNLIDQHLSEFMNVYGDLTVKPGCQANYYSMIQQYSDSEYTTTSFQGGRIYIPLQFWFCRNISNRNSSLVFPLCSLYNSTIELSLDIRAFSTLIVAEDGVLDGLTPIPTGGFNISYGALFVDYVILDEDERLGFIKIPKQLNIISQLQFYKFDVQAGISESTFSLKSLHYLVSELIFVVRRNDALVGNDYFNYSTSLTPANKNNPLSYIRLLFDGRERIKQTPASNFTQLEPAKVHTNVPVNKFVHVYSFSLEPERIEQPTGLMNFSELQEPLLHLWFNGTTVASTLYVFAVNYNVLMGIQGAGWLLHNLSKSIPTMFPDPECMPTTPLYKSQNA